MKGKKPRVELDRFMEKVSPEPMSGCWLWFGAVERNGYGAFSIRHAEKDWAHRVVWRLFRGACPVGMQLDHLCRVRSCVNPAHLEVVTQHENWRRGESVTARRLRTLVCTRGHEYTQANTRHDRQGHRHCMTCDRWHAAESRRRAATA